MTWRPEWIYWSLLLIFIPIMVSHVAVELGRVWAEYRSRSQALEVLRVYAERGDEPPASVTGALAVVGSGYRPAPVSAFVASPAPQQTRAYHMSRVAMNVVAVGGWVGIAWWRMPAEGAPGALVIVAVIAAIFCGGLVAAHLVGVFTTPNSGRAGDDR